MARRVETHQAEEVELLQDMVAEEWEKTSTYILPKLAHSMHKRCELVIAAKGGYIDY
jgi:hypothetical protein